MPKKAFTLLELIIVIIIIGILATLGFSQYAKMVEKGRTSEANMILGQLRTAEVAYYQEHGVYGNIDDLGVDAPTVCKPTHYFYYQAFGGKDGSVFANRCISGGKTPNAVPSPLFPAQAGNSFAYTIGLDINGTFSGGQRAAGVY